ncbi:hypothetical protein ASE75_11065 [Sphingomonas sp. Leaf17]|uniref:BLUF domain-containing protein n=1 Tax=Sphingomonas sp. Leaf17 TaxID=1735683 RepID=UPI0006FC18B3|nr:BLUF domain-containing protein [Sphingomonas sp. Leaf17]KQM63644.1 hypothetical protein ASE75_11065 [Sphingomonas sp. Leaf17]
MRQIVYISTARPEVAEAGAASEAQILAVSRRNNARDAVTGVLFFNGKRFLQALEGQPDVVARAYDRIKADPRHFAVVTLSERVVETREFGDWAMASSSGSDQKAAETRIAALVAGATPSVRATFESFTRVKRAA